MEVKKFLYLAILSVLLISVASSEQHIVINSEDWTEVYSGLLYSKIMGQTADFLTSERAGLLVPNAFSSENTEILLFSSSNRPFVRNYQDIFSSKGFEVEEISSSNLNLQLLEELNGITNFIIVSDSYGYNSLAVGPYAIKTNSWVIFANNRNIDLIEEVLDERTIDNLIVYGYLEESIREVLEKYSPEIIYSANRFEDNIKMVEKYLEISPETKQVILTNGEFIESEILSPNNPVLFTGRQNVPDTIRDYLKESSLEVGVLIGNELVGAATNIRESTGLYVMVKFARGSRQQADGVAAVEGLDLFPVPSPIISLEIESISRNLLTNNLEVTYLSSSNLPIYLKNSITLGDETNRLRLGDDDTIFVNPESYKTVVYSLEEFPSFDYEEAVVFLIFGETKNSLDRVIEGTYPIGSVEVIDSCDLEILDLRYDLNSENFKINVKNPSEVNCYAQGVLQDVELSLETLSFGSEETIFVRSGEKGEIIVPAEEFTENNIELNPFINTIVSFGERESSLVKSVNERMELKIIRFGMIVYIVIILVILAIIFFLLFLYWRKKERSAFDI